MQQGGDRGKGPNTTGTQPTRRKSDAPAAKPGRQQVKGGAGRKAGHGKHAARRASGQKTSETRKAGPRKTPAGTTTKSGDR